MPIEFRRPRCALNFNTLSDIWIIHKLGRLTKESQKRRAKSKGLPLDTIKLIPTLLLLYSFILKLLSFKRIYLWMPRLLKAGQMAESQAHLLLLIFELFNQFFRINAQFYDQPSWINIAARRIWCIFGLKIWNISNLLEMPSFDVESNFFWMQHTLPKKGGIISTKMEGSKSFGSRVGYRIAYLSDLVWIQNDAFSMSSRFKIQIWSLKRDRDKCKPKKWICCVFKTREKKI